MDDLSRKFKAFDWKGLQKQARKVQASTASALKDLVMTDLENKVRAATGDTNWGASGADLAEIAQGTYNREDFTLIMSIIWQRLASTRWRCVYKALDVLKYLVLHGASRVLEETREALPHIRRLEHYAYVDSVTRRDEGANVRARASAFVAILTDDAVLEEERTKSAALRAKIGIAVPSSHYTAGAGAGGGLSSDDYRFGAASGRNSGGYDPPPMRTANSAAAAAFDGFGNGQGSLGQRPTQTQPTSTVDDLLGDMEPVPALPAPDAGSRSGAAPGGLADLLASPNGGGVTNGAAVPPAQPASSLFGAPADDDDSDDDDFDPRAFASAPKPATGGTAQMPTSRLVANLAAARTAAADSEARTKEAATPLSAMQAQAAVAAAVSQKPAEDVAYGGLVHFENLMLDKTTRVESKPIGSNTTATTAPVLAPKTDVAGATGVEADPFGDLLSTAKKSGVL